jgi:hypothetical protein
MPTATSELLPGYYIDQVAHGAWKTIPWPRDPGELDRLLRSSLGPALIDWAEGRTDEPGLTHHLTGRPWEFTPGQKRFLILWYALTPFGRWLYRSGLKRGAKGTGKDPFAGALCDMELLARVRFSHWDEHGLPVGDYHLMPLVQVAANSESQAKDVMRVANALLSPEARAYYNLDPGETRTVIKSTGGRMEILTSSEKSSEGDPATFILMNESHHMTEASGGNKIAEVARRNVGKSPAFLQARLCEMSNAHQQGGDSAAERTFEAWQKQVSGQFDIPQDILYDSIEADPATNLYDDESRMRGLQQAYSDAPWADLERLSGEVLDPRTSTADSIRYYMNGLAAAEDAWVDPQKFDALADAGRVVEEGEQIAVFADLSKSGDATGVVGCCLSDGYVFVLGVWHKPRGEGKGWLAPRAEVDAVIRAAWDRYDVPWTGIDPSPATDDETEALYWQPMIDGLHRDRQKAKGIIWATPGVKGSSVLYDMRLSQTGGVKRNQEFTAEAMATVLAIEEDMTLSHDGTAMLRSHVHNAKRRPNQWGTSLSKATRSSTHLVDLAVCMVGARLGRRLALNSGKVKRPRRGTGRVGTVL